MKKNKFITVVLLSILTSAVLAEEKTTFALRIGAEAGIDYLYSDRHAFDQIRESNEYEYDYCGVNFNSTDLFSSYLGIKPELFLFEEKIGISLGARFLTMGSSYETDNQFFYWKLREHETTTNYVKIEKIEQKSYFLEIPVEFRFFLGKNKKRRRNKDRFCRIYLKVGGSVGFRLNTNTDIYFVNKSMARHEEEVRNQIGHVDDVTGKIFAAVGMKLGRKIPVNIEFQFPNARLNSKSSSLIDSNIGIGFQATIQSPVLWKKTKSEQTESNY